MYSQGNLRNVKSLLFVYFHLEQKDVCVEVELQLLVRVVNAPVAQAQQGQITSGRET